MFHVHAFHCAPAFLTRVLLICALAAAAHAQAPTGASWVSVIDAELDLATQVEQTADAAGPMPVPEGPRLVVGQGPHPQNQTLVRVLSKYGLAERQFLAYPGGITGGVRVNAGNLYPLGPDPGGFYIVASPLTSSATREIRIFDQQGRQVGAFEPDTAVAAPFAVAVGDFMDTSAGDEIAVTSSAPADRSQAPILIYRPGGEPGPVLWPADDLTWPESVEISTVHVQGPDLILGHYRQGGRAFYVEPASGEQQELSLAGLPADVSVSESAFADQVVAAGGPETVFSTLHAIDSQGAVGSVDAGRRENSFWVHPTEADVTEGLIYMFDSGLEGWWSGNAAANIANQNGELVVQFGDHDPFDPFLNGPVENYSADQFSEFAMRVTVSGAPVDPFDFSVYFFPQAGGLGIADFQLSNGTQTVRFNLADAARPGLEPHSGTITYFRLDAPDIPGAEYGPWAGAEIRLDWIALTPDTAWHPANTVFTFDDDTEGWSSPASGGLIAQRDGALEVRYFERSPFDPYLNAPVLNYDADLYDEFALKATVDNGPAGPLTCRLFWFPESGGNGSLAFQLQPGENTVRFNIDDLYSGPTPHDGTIVRYRLDIPDGGTYAQWQDALTRIDWVAITDEADYTGGTGGSFWGQYVRPAQFRHLRTDANSPGYDGTDFDNPSESYWTGPQFDNYISSTQANYFSQDQVWEPTYSHRMFQGRWDHWDDEIDPATGLPAFSALTRLNNRNTYLELDSEFLTMTWAPGVGPIENLIVYPVRAYLRALVEKYRGEGGDPERMVALEPNHEFEVNITEDDSVGDYHPANIAGFYAYLVRLYNHIGHINDRFGTSFASQDDFDAPRNTGRGAWDAYNTGNDFFLAWVDYMRRVVNYRIMQGQREALLAGFPPQILTAHQIPSEYAVGPATNGRITPVDWAMSNGMGFGGTRYGSQWHKDASNWVQGAKSSGHHTVTVGEYHPLTNNQTDATNQLRYMRDHGVNFVHHMVWDNQPWNEVGAQAYLTLAQEDVPRPGVTGGIGPIRAVHQPTPQGARPYNIVQIGVGDARQGLLKGVNADGSFEGTVYVTPFHAHVAVDLLAEDATRVLSDSDYISPGIDGLNSGDVIELALWARSDDADARFTLNALHDWVELAGVRRVQGVTAQWRHYRWNLRIQNPMETVVVLLNSGERDTPSGGNQTIEMQEFALRVHRLQVARKEFGIDAGTPHAGGVTFDLLSASHRPAATMASPFIPAEPTQVRRWTLME